MAIVSSVVSQDPVTQADGRRWVYEAHTDQFGKVWPLSYLAGAGVDINAVLAARAITLAASLAADELAANVAAITLAGSLAVLTFTQTTAVALRTALRQAYAGATQRDAIMIGDFLASLTDAQLQTAFGMTAGQVTTLRANRLTPAASAAATIRAAVGA